MLIGMTILVKEIGYKLLRKHTLLDEVERIFVLRTLFWIRVKYCSKPSVYSFWTVHEANGESLSAHPEVKHDERACECSDPPFDQ